MAIRLQRVTMGPHIAERQKTFEEWCIKHSQPIAVAASSALELRKNVKNIGES